MVAENQKIKIWKIGEAILLSTKSHIILIWFAFSLVSLFYAAYIFYSQIYIISSEELSPTTQFPIAKKNQLSQIIKGLDERDARRLELGDRNIPNPFEPLP